MLKNLVLSIALGLLYSLIAFSLQTSGELWVQYFLFLFVPLPIFLAMFSFPFWITLAAFIPSLGLMITDLVYAISLNLVLTVPLLIIFIFLHLKRTHQGKYIPLIIIGYGLLLLISVDIYFLKHNLSLPDLILDTLSTMFMYINNIQPNMLSDYDTEFLLNISAFTLPTLIIFIFYLILTTNYIFANWIVNRKSLNQFKIQIGNSLPKYYVYIFIFYLAILLITNYFLKINWNLTYILYNIAMIMVIPFLVPGLGIINYIIARNKLFLFLFIILLFLLNLYVIIAICILGFLKEAQLFNILKSKFNLRR